MPLAQAVRVRNANDAPLRPERDYVLYWMTAARRPHHNFALEHAVALAQQQRKPLVILEALRCGYRWASRRHHRFIMDGMADHIAWFRQRPAYYLPYLEPKHGAGRGLLKALASRACAVITDDYPCFFLPRMLASAARQLDVALIAIDGNGLLPMRAAPKKFSRAVDLRRFLQKQLRPHLEYLPLADPLEGLSLPLIDRPSIDSRHWPAATLDQLQDPRTLDTLPIDQDVDIVELAGGYRRGAEQLAAFIDRRLPQYHTHRNHPDEDASSGLSPYLHYGHVGAHQAFAAVAQSAIATDSPPWSVSLLAPKANGARSGWWGMSEPAESFMDELITWRELGFNGCTFEPDYDQYSSLPQWAQKTLAEHAADPRPYTYSLEQLEAAQTHDEIWNAAQRQLLTEGIIHNYLRMLWGKKILHWTASPQHALDIMIELNNKYALDGRDPNSYSGIFWVLGRYDRAWGPERPIFGKIRYMTSDSTRRKLHLKQYLEQWRETAG